MKKYYSLKKCFFVSCLCAMFAIAANAQSNYTVTAIPHQVYVATSPVQSNADDMYSSIIPLTFDFKYYGNIYNQVVIGSNGMIQFDTSFANQYNNYNYTMPIPHLDFPIKNAIFGCYTDMRNGTLAPTSNGSIKTAVSGFAPFRKFVVIFDNQPAYMCGESAITTFQIVIHETLNIIDIQIVQRQSCSTWLQGQALTGIINSTGELGIAAPGRNRGPWEANQEGWRFSLPQDNSVYNYTKCDTNLNGVQAFDLDVIRTDLQNQNLEFYQTQTDASEQINPISTLYANMTSPEIIYTAQDGIVTQIILRVLDCSNDYDQDSVPTAEEDLNADGNLANDDTDGDGIPNFMDNDDDGDMVLTSFEYVFTSNPDDKTAMTLLDTDSDGIPNYLDDDDDGDGILTKDEVVAGSTNPMDADQNGNGIPDYLDSPQLSLIQDSLMTLISVYPNPASDVFYISNKTNQAVSSISVYSINGMLVKEIRNAAEINAIQVSDLQSGIYFVKLTVGESVINYKLIKK